MLTKQNKTGQCHKIRPIVNHMNELFQAAFSNEPEQSIEEHMAKFKGSFSKRQYLKMKPKNGDLNGGFNVLVPPATYASLICILLEERC